VASGHVGLENALPDIFIARFRIKRKQRATNLGRSISDLTGRVEDLAREVADLRQENGWLKEIVMLKGSTRVGSLNLGYDPSDGASLPLSGQGVHDSQEPLSAESSRKTKAVEKTKKRKPRK